MFECFAPCGPFRIDSVMKKIKVKLKISPGPVLPVSPVNTAVGKNPPAKVLSAAKDAALPGRGGDHLDPAVSPLALDPPSMPRS